MKTCTHCDIRFTGDLDRCPLCGNALSGTATPSHFPTNTLPVPKRKASTLIGVITVLVMLMTFAGGLYAHQSWWALGAEEVALALNYLFLRNVILHAPSFLRIIQRYFLLIIGVALLLLLVTKQAVIATFIIPVICLVALITNSVLVLIFRDAFVKGYAKYLLYELVLGFLPLLLMLSGLVTWPYLAYASACVSVLLLATLLLLCRKRLILEYKKLFSA